MSEFSGVPSDDVITPLPVWGPGYEISFEYYLNSDGGDIGYQYLFAVVGNADNTDDFGFGQPLIFYNKDSEKEFYANGKMPMWFALQGIQKGPDEAGDNLNLWKLPYGGSVTIDVNKWHKVSVSSIKEDEIVRRFAHCLNFNMMHSIIDLGLHGGDSEWAHGFQGSECVSFKIHKHASSIQGNWRLPLGGCKNKETSDSII